MSRKRTGLTAARPVSESTASGLVTKRARGRPSKDTVAADSSRDILLDVAAKMFSDWGYEPVSTAAVARSAGMAQSMVHYHFGTKEQLWREVIKRLIRQRKEYFPIADADLPPLSPVERLKQMIRRLVEINATTPHYIRIITHEAMSSTPRFTWLMESYLEGGFTAFEDAIREAMAQGHIRTLPEVETSAIITSAASMTFSVGAIAAYMHGHNPSAPDRVRLYSDTIITILFDGLLGPATADPAVDTVTPDVISPSDPL